MAGLGQCCGHAGVSSTAFRVRTGLSSTWTKLVSPRTCRKQVALVINGINENGGATAPTRLAIEVSDLELSVMGRKGVIPVLNGCSLAIPEGQLWMLLGPNGCGKSTLLKALAGLLMPSSGCLYVARPKSFVFQNPDHQVVLPTAEADVAFGLGQYRLPKEEVRTRVWKSLEAVGMLEYAERPISTLSGGQKQRVAIAGALAEESRVLLLDELTTFLDEHDQIGVLEAVRQVVGGPRGVTALWVTHRFEELDYADGAIYMENGIVVFVGTVEGARQFVKQRQDRFMEANGLAIQP